PEASNWCNYQSTFRRFVVNEFDLPAPETPVLNSPAPETPVTDTAVPAAAPETPAVTPTPPEAPVPTTDPARAAAGRLGGLRVHRLAELGREYEREHGLKPGRQRIKQLIQLGKRYEVEHGLRVAKLRRRRKGDAWQEFLAALSRVIKPAYRPAVE